MFHDKIYKEFLSKGVKKVISLGLDSRFIYDKSCLIQKDHIIKDEDDSNIDQSKEIFRRTLSRYDK